MCALGDQSADARHAPDVAIASTVVTPLPLTAMKLLAPALVAAIEHKAWQSKVGALGVCGDLAHRVPAYFMRTLPEVFPRVSGDGVRHAPKVTAVAEGVMPRFAAACENAEIVGMLPLVIRAIGRPRGNGGVPGPLMETTFVNSWTRPQR